MIAVERSRLYFAPELLFGSWIDGMVAHRTPAYGLWRPAVLGSLLLLALAGGRGIGTPRAAAQDLPPIQLSAGWNLIGLTTGITLDATHGPALVRGPGDSDFRATATGDLQGGRGAFVYVDADTSITLGRTAAEFSRLLAPPGSVVLIGNPSTSDVLPISGADEAFICASGGFQPASTLQPGQGALAIVGAGGEVVVGRAPGGPEAQEVGRLQAELAVGNTDRATIDALGAVSRRCLPSIQRM